MTQQEIDAIVAGLAPVLREFVDQAVAPFGQRLADLERGLAAGESELMAACRQELAAMPDRIKTAVADAVAALPPPPPGRDGTSVTIDDLLGPIDAAVERHVAALPPAPAGQDGAPGRDADPERTRAMVEEIVAAAVEKIPTPRDGVGLAGALKDDEGRLVLTLSDGTMVKLGRVDGAPGKDGADGRDGLGFDDLAVVEEGGAFVLRFTRGETVKEFTLARPTLADAYRGVWSAGAFKRGDVVTSGGSLWIAMADTEGKPEACDDWKLAVKRGRDGREVVRLAPPARPEPVRL